MDARVLPRDRAAVILVTAPWCGPCGPAPTVLRELSRRWEGQVHAVLVEDPTDEQLDALAVSVLPTWMRVTPAGGKDQSGDGAVAGAGGDAVTWGGRSGQRLGKGAIVADVVGCDPDGGAVLLPGAWAVQSFHGGALAKHQVDQQFGHG